MRPILLLVVVAVLVVAAAALPTSPKRRRAKVPIFRTHGLEQGHEAAVVNQTLGQEVCRNCKPGTKPQDPVAGVVSAKNPGKDVSSRGPGLRIINGGYAYAGQFPWIANIIMDVSWGCGGSLISDMFILTAAQCTSGYSQFQITLGDTHSYQDSPYYQYFFTYKGIWHEDYQEEYLTHDIGLIELLYPITTFTDGVRPIRLPSDSSKTYVGVTATVAGWGENEFGYDEPDLKFVEQPVMSNAECVRFLGCRVQSTNICGDGEGKVGTCEDPEMQFQDAGGPLATQESDGKWTLIGIASFESDIGCDLGYPSAYTRVSEYLQWIQNNTGIQP